MPNWVTNKIQAAPHVILAMLNAEGQVDFNTIAPFQGPNRWDTIYADAEMAAEIAVGIPIDTNPLIGKLQLENRKRLDLRTVSEAAFKQFLGMLENYRACGHLHSMSFASEVWGTKWNACYQEAFPDEGRCQFETAWSCPQGILLELSKRFPEEAIDVTYADEDIGNNCGTFTLKAGVVIKKNIAPRWSTLNAAGKTKWMAFAHQVKGTKPEPGKE